MKRGDSRGLKEVFDHLQDKATKLFEKARYCLLHLLSVIVGHRQQNEVGATSHGFHTLGVINALYNPR